MALVYSPTGQPMIVPDDMAGMFGQPSPDLSLAVPGQPGIIRDIVAPPPPPPPPPPTTQHVGPGSPAYEETAGPTPAATVLPSVTGQPEPTPIAAPAEIPMGDPTKEIKARNAAATKAQAAAQKQAAQQAAYAATPEGRIAAGEQGALEANRQQQAITKTSGDVAAQEAAKLADIKQASLRSQAYIDEANAAVDAKRQEDITKAIKEREDAVNAEANYKIDDHRRWNNLSTGRKVLAGISVALSGLGDALAGRAGPNMALGIITGAIKDDVEAQVREREQLGKRIGIKQNSLDNYRKLAADAHEAGQMKIAEEYKRTAQETEAASAQYGSDKARLAAQQLSAELNAKASEIVSRYGEAAYQRGVTARAEADRRSQIGIGYGNLALNREQFAYSKKRDQDQMLIELAKASKKTEDETGGLGGSVRTVLDEKGQPKVGKDGRPVVTVDVLRQPDGSVWAPDKDIRKKLIDQRTGVQGLYDVMGQVAEWRKKYGGETAKGLDSSAKDEYDRLVNRAVFYWAGANGISTADENSFNKARDALFGADPSNYNTSDVIGRIERTLREEDDRYYSAQQSAGYRGERTKFFDPRAFQAPGLTQDQREFKAYLKSDLDQSGNTRVLQNVGGMAQSSDPEIRKRGLAMLQQIAKESPLEVDRRSAQQWLDSGIGQSQTPQTQPAAPYEVFAMPAGGQVIAPDPATGTVFVRFPDGVVRRVGKDSAAAGP